jgi:hypothetical protein
MAGRPREYERNYAATSEQLAAQAKLASPSPDRRHETAATAGLQKANQEVEQARVKSSPAPRAPSATTRRSRITWWRAGL